MPEVVLNLEYVVYKEDLETLSVKIMSPSTLAKVFGDTALLGVA